MAANRMQQLEEQFTALEEKLEDSPEKTGLSLLHAIIHEVARGARSGPHSSASATSATDVAELYRQAPAMQGAAVSTPLAVGTPAPEFALPDSRGELVRLSDHRGKPVVLVFYPLDWSPGCSQQLDLYSMEWGEFERRDARMLAISVDSIYSHGAWAAVRGLKMPLLSDFHPKGEVARKYRVFRDADGFSDRAVYLVDAEGVIRHSHVSPQLHHVPDVGRLLEALDAVAGAPAEGAPAGG
jgi:peroxiredoxin